MPLIKILYIILYKINVCCSYGDCLYGSCYCQMFVCLLSRAIMYMRTRQVLLFVCICVGTLPFWTDELRLVYNCDRHGDANCTERVKV